MLLSVTQRAAIWVPFLAFALLYTLFFICTGLATWNPKLWNEAKSRLLACGRRRKRGGAAAAAATPKSLAAEGDAQAPAAGRPRSAPAAPRAARPAVLTWQGLGCEYNTHEGVKAVLQDVSGEARPKEMVALMGPSGSGKSTLIDMLAARKSTGRLSGDVRVNGRPRTSAGFRRISSYVPQEDNLLPILNVAETCRLYANLTLPRNTSPDQAARRVEEVLHAMGMVQAHDRLVGGVLPGGLLLRGLSGGERKRLWVAVGIIATPSVVFLDEPTTGLDSCAAFAVVSLMRRTALESGLTVIASIHQPCSAVFAAFDACTLLAHGLLLYHGPRGAMGEWFEAVLGLGPWNPAVHGIVSDWAMDLVSVEFTKPADHGRTINSYEELRAAARKFSATYHAGRDASALEAAAEPDANGHRRTRAAGAAAKGVNACAAHGDASGGDGRTDSDGELDTELGWGRAGVVASAAAHGQRLRAGDAGSKHNGSGGGLVPASLGAPGAAACGDAGGSGDRATWVMQFRMLLWRELLSTMRNPVDVAGRMMCFCILAVFTGTVYWNLDEGVDGMRNRINLLYINAMCLLLMPFVYMSLYAQDKQTCVADFSARLYSVSAYYAAKQLAVLPFVIANVGANAFIVSGMAGLRTDPGALFTFAGIGVLYYLLAQQEGAFVVTITYSSVNLLMSNYIMRFQDMQQPWISFLRWVSATNYAFSAYMRNQFQGVDVSCANGIAPSLVTLLQSLMPRTKLLRTPAVERMLVQPGADCIMSLDAVLAYFDVTWPVWGYALSLVIYLLIVHGLTFIGLCRLAYKERR